MAQIINITSEALQATIRRLLPSQQGFGEDLQASNVIVPMIDITPTAEGSILREDLQKAINFGGSTPFSVRGSTTTLVTSSGFYRITACSFVLSGSSVVQNTKLQMSDGFATKDLWTNEVQATGTVHQGNVFVDLVFFVNAGESITASATGNGSLFGQYQQVADVNGNLTAPVGYQSQ